AGQEMLCAAQEVVAVAGEEEDPVADLARGPTHETAQDDVRSDGEQVRLPSGLFAQLLVLCRGQGRGAVAEAVAIGVRHEHERHGDSAEQDDEHLGHATKCRRARVQPGTRVTLSVGHMDAPAARGEGTRAGAAREALSFRAFRLPAMTARAPPTVPGRTAVTRHGSGCAGAAAPRSSRFPGGSEASRENRARRATRPGSKSVPPLLIATPMTTPLSCWILGADTLLLQCAESWREAGHDLRGVITAEPRLLAWCTDNDVRTLPPGDDLAVRLAQEPAFDYLFAITWLEMVPAEVLAVPRRMAINFHDAPLPRYAGLNATTWGLLAREP